MSAKMTLRFVLYVALLILAINLRAAVDAFSVPKWSEKNSFQQHQKRDPHALTLQASDSKTLAATTASGISAMLVLLQPGIALASTEIEVAELPPPWIPVVFGIGLVVV
jgi:hypothetical protein